MSGLAAAGPTDPLLRQRAVAELEQIRTVHAQGTRRVVLVPWLTEEPRGPERLQQLAQGVTSHARARDTPQRTADA